MKDGYRSYSFTFRQNALTAIPIELGIPIPSHRGRWSVLPSWKTVQLPYGKPKLLGMTCKIPNAWHFLFLPSAMPLHLVPCHTECCTCFLHAPRPFGHADSSLRSKGSFLPFFPPNFIQSPHLPHMLEFWGSVYKQFLVVLISKLEVVIYIN